MRQGAEVHGMSRRGHRSRRWSHARARAWRLPHPIRRARPATSRSRGCGGTRRTVMSAHREVDLAPGTCSSSAICTPRRTGADHQYRTFGHAAGCSSGPEDLPDTLVARRDRRITGRWNGPVAATTRLASMVPAEVSTVKPGRPTLRTTFLTSTPVRIGASNSSRRPRNRPPPGPCRGNRRDRCRIPFPEAVVPGRAVGHQRVSTSAAPGLGDAVALQDQVRHARPAQVLAHRHAGLAAPTTRVSVFSTVRRARGQGGAIQVGRGSVPRTGRSCSAVA